MPIARKFAAALVASALTLPAVAQEVVLKVHHFWPPGAMGPSTSGTSCNTFADAVLMLMNRPEIVVNKSTKPIG